MTSYEDLPDRVVEQRVRNRIIEVLELTSSYEDQIAYERAVPSVNVPNHIVNLWEDWAPRDPRVHRPSDVYSRDEVLALQAYQSVWERVCERTPDPLPSIAEVQRLPEWDELRRAAADALAVFQRRGVRPEDE